MTGCLLVYDAPTGPNAMPHPQCIAFVAPRFSEQGTVGGAETLLKNLALRAASAGRHVAFLTTCAEDHFSWENVLPPGQRRVGGLDVHFFPVDARDVPLFLRLQEAICHGRVMTDEEERTWIQNSVNSEALCAHLRAHGSAYDRIVVGPYLFGLTYAVASLFPEKTLLVPCLHDEPFARLRLIRKMFHRVAGCLFNSEPERALAERLYEFPRDRSAIVGMGLDPFEADGSAFARRHRRRAPYVLYAGRREPLKGTPLLLDYLLTFRERTGRDVELVLIGRGPVDPPPSLQPHVLDLGFVSEEEKHEVMAGALAFVHPSALESLGIVVLEAWLARAPALVHARSEVLVWQCRRSRGGLWFRNYPEFEEALLLLMDRPDLRHALGEAGRRYVLEEYAWEKVLRRFFGALEQLPPS